MAQNPHWTIDELILALDLYFRVSVANTIEKHSEIVALSELLNTLPIHPKELMGVNFRSTDAVYMKLYNFRRLDPNYHGKGLDAGSKLDEVVWDEFANDRGKLQRVASAIRRNNAYFSQEEKTDPIIKLPDDEGFIEGRLLETLHKRRERNPGLAEKKKKSVLKAKGKLACEVCGFDFAAFYGPIGGGFAECHHLVPLSDYDEGKRTQLTDLAIVCANCHRMLHRGKPLLSINELQKIVLAQVDLD